MAQHDYVIDNQTAPNFRSDLNNALAAIVSNNSGDFAPSPIYANMIWYDTTLKRLRMRSEANDAWIDLGTLDQVNKVFAAVVPLASQAEAEAGTNNTKTMTPLRVAQAVASAIAGSATGGVGTYAFLSVTSVSITVSPGQTFAGSSLQYAGVNNSVSGGLNALTSGRTGSLSGTWQAMGFCTGLGNRESSTMFLRIS